MSDSSDEEETLNKKYSKIVKNYEHGSGDDIEMNDNKDAFDLEHIPDNVIFCGQQSLHCHNVGNEVFKSYVHAAVVLDFKCGGKKRSRYNKKNSVAEIMEKLKDYDWRKLGSDGEKRLDGEKLTFEEISLKVRKSVNDRIRKNRIAFGKKSGRLFK